MCTVRLVRLYDCTTVIISGISNRQQSTENALRTTIEQKQHCNMPQYHSNNILLYKYLVLNTYANRARIHTHIIYCIRAIRVSVTIAAEIA